MNRRILFRGQRVEDGKWIIGHLWQDDDDHFPMIHQNGTLDKWEQVKEETVGQFTGLTDCKGIDIFEGDILSTDLARPFCEVVFRSGCFALRLNDGGEDFYDILAPLEDNIIKTKYHSVVGNIHSNPELLKSE